MTVIESHLQVNQRLQEVASYKRDKLFPQEIDMALNKAMFRLLEEAVEKQFSATQVNLSHVSALIRKNKIAEVILPRTTDVLYEENLNNSYVVLAPDVYWLINSRVETVVDPLNCEVAPTLGTSTYSEYVAVIPIPSPNLTAPFYANIAVTSSTLSTLYSIPPSLTSGFNSRNSVYVLTNNIVETVNRRTDVAVYWERYRGTYYRNSLIFVSPVSMGLVSLTGTGLVTSSTANIRNDYTIFNRSLIGSLPSKKVEVRPTKINEANLLYSGLKENQFYATSNREVALDQTLDYLTIYRDLSFIVTRAYYDYVRKPRTISLLLGQSCELADAAHPKVIDLAVEILRLDTKDEAYQQTVQDTQLRTN